jgi:6-phosphogluconate dehydrogenase
MKEERVAASKILGGPKFQFQGDKAAFIEHIRQALLASKIVSYAQGFMLLREAAREYHWNLNYGSIANVWRAGCIIRSAFLGKIKLAYQNHPELSNLLLDAYFKDVIERCQNSWRTAVAQAVTAGVAAPAFTTALAFYDGYRSERLPANLLQAQRDYFGAHTYERIDQPRHKFFHTNWTGKGGNVSAGSYTV